MLTLTRKRNESIILTVLVPDHFGVKHVEEEILVTVISVREGRTQLGIEASDNVIIDRKEIYDRKIMESSHKVR